MKVLGQCPHVLVEKLSPLSIMISLICKYSVPTSKKTYRVKCTKDQPVYVFKEIITVYSENDTEPMDAMCVCGGGGRVKFLGI